MNWRKHEMGYVMGCIDSYGEIRGKATRQMECHPPELSKGKRWRFCIWSQEFSIIMPKTLEEYNDPHSKILTDEEAFLVWNWLMEKGYTDEKTSPK